MYPWFYKCFWQVVYASVKDKVWNESILSMINDTYGLIYSFVQVLI